MMQFHRLHHKVRTGQKLQACSDLCCTHIEDLSVRLGGRSVLDPVNIHLHCGEITALIGPNGAGKSTLLRALIGEIPHAGRVHFQDAEGGAVDSIRMGYVPQNPKFAPGTPMTVLDLFELSLKKSWNPFGSRSGARKSLLEQAESALAEVEVADLMHQKISTLSGGEMQRVLLALALVPRPNLLLLDEPVSGVDARGRSRLYEIIDRVRNHLDLGVILVSHDFLEIARWVDRVVLLDQEVKQVGAPSEVFGSEYFLNYFGSDLSKALLNIHSGATL